MTHPAIPLLGYWSECELFNSIFSENLKLFQFSIQLVLILKVLSFNILSTYWKSWIRGLHIQLFLHCGRIKSIL